MKRKILSTILVFVIVAAGVPLGNMRAPSKAEATEGSTWISSGLGEEDIRSIVIGGGSQTAPSGGETAPTPDPGYGSSPSNPSIMYAGGTSDKVYKTIDGGSSWTTEAAYGRYLAISQSNPNIAYATSHIVGTYRTTDRGGNWEKVASAPSGALSVAINPQNPDIVYLGTQGKVYKSTNGGLTWEPYSVSVTNTLAWINPLVIDPRNPQILYAGTQGTGDGIFKSIDGGQNWASINDGLPKPNPTSPSIDVRSLAIDPSDSNVLYLGISTYSAWLNPPYPNTTIVFKTNNGGIKWAPAGGFEANSSAYSIGINPRNTSEVFVGMAGAPYGVYKSSDGGSSWQDISYGLPAPHNNNSVSSLAFDSNGSYLYAGTSKGVWRLDITPSAVATPPVVTITSVSSDPEPLVTGFADSTDANLANIEYQLDSTASTGWQPITSFDYGLSKHIDFSFHLPKISSGSHILYMRASDTNNNMSEIVSASFHVPIYIEIEDKDNLSNDVVEGKVLEGFPNARLQITNKKQYWTKVTIELLPPSLNLEPFAGDIYAKVHLLGPGASATYVVNFQEVGNSVSVFVDPTMESGQEAPLLNVFEMVTHILPVVRDVPKENIIDLLEALKDIDGIMAASQKVGKPNASVGDYISAAWDIIKVFDNPRQLAKLRVALIRFVGYGGGQFTKILKSVFIIDEIINAARSTYDMMYGTLAGSPSGSLMFRVR